MLKFDPDTFGTLNAFDYDDWQYPGTTDQAVEVLYDLYGDSHVLELGIGSGRIALPLAAKGTRITGIDASPAMIELMQAKPSGRDIPVTIGDMAELEVEGTFDHAFLVFNTICNLPDQAAQVRCFQNVATKLHPGGTFLVETFVPTFDDFTNNQKVTTKKLDMTSVWLDAVEHHPATQVLQFQRIRILPEGIKLIPLRLRYVYPAELDLMAQLADMRLKYRWGGWDKSAFTSESGYHVSVYEKVAS